MPGIALGVLFLGYSTWYYGLTQVRGGNWGFLDLVIPSRWPGAAGIPPDQGAPTQNPNDAAVSGGTAPANPANPGQPNIITVIPAPAGAPSGTYGVDVNGNIYVKQGGAWTIYQTATGQSVSYA